MRLRHRIRHFCHVGSVIIIDVSIVYVHHIGLLSLSSWSQSLCRWVLSVRRGYRRDVAYHNWNHALSTAQCMFALLKGTGHLQVSETLPQTAQPSIS